MEILQVTHMSAFQKQKQTCIFLLENPLQLWAAHLWYARNINRNGRKKYPLILKSMYLISLVVLLLFNSKWVNTIILITQLILGIVPKPYVTFSIQDTWGIALRKIFCNCNITLCFFQEGMSRTVTVLWKNPRFKNNK